MYNKVWEAYLQERKRLPEQYSLSKKNLPGNINDQEVSDSVLHNKSPSVPLFLANHARCKRGSPWHKLFAPSIDPFDFPVNHQKRGIIQITPIQCKTMNYHPHPP